MPRIFLDIDVKGEKGIFQMLYTNLLNEEPYVYFFEKYFAVLDQLSIELPIGLIDELHHDKAFNVMNKIKSWN